MRKAGRGQSAGGRGKVGGNGVSFKKAKGVSPCICAERPEFRSKDFKLVGRSNTVRPIAFSCCLKTFCTYARTDPNGTGAGLGLAGGPAAPGTVPLGGGLGAGAGALTGGMLGAKAGLLTGVIVVFITWASEDAPEDAEDKTETCYLKKQRDNCPLPGENPLPGDEPRRGTKCVYKCPKTGRTIDLWLGQGQNCVDTKNFPK